MEFFTVGKIPLHISYNFDNWKENYFLYFHHCSLCTFLFRKGRYLILATWHPFYLIYHQYQVIYCIQSSLSASRVLKTRKLIGKTQSNILHSMLTTLEWIYLYFIKASALVPSTMILMTETTTDGIFLTLDHISQWNVLLDNFLTSQLQICLTF